MSVGCTWYSLVKPNFVKTLYQNNIVLRGRNTWDRSGYTTKYFMLQKQLYLDTGD
jgi:hypothetical protein